MALATLELCFMNPALFQRNIKIRKAEAASVRAFSRPPFCLCWLTMYSPQLIMRAANPREMGFIFREYARKIHAKAVFTDPSFLRLSIACGKVRPLSSPSTSLN
jgi:farnesyl-diphosphate farnesyltransferase